MKVIFLDFDGVITIPPKWHINSEKIKYIKRIVDETGAKIVVSSSWRRNNVRDTVESITKRYKRCQWTDMVEWFVNNLYDVTHTYRGLRGQEIKDWLNEHDDIDNYVIIDDDSDFLDEQLYHFVETNFEDGITEVEATRAIKVLNEYFFQNPMALNFILRNEHMNKCKGLPNRCEELKVYNDLCDNLYNRYGS